MQRMEYYLRPFNYMFTTLVTEFKNTVSYIFKYFKKKEFHFSSSNKGT